MKNFFCLIESLVIIINSIHITTVDCEASLCHLQAVTGFCRGYIPRYYYNVDADMCQSFIWGGCGGNENNFETMEDCNQMCKIVVPNKVVSYSSLGGRRSRSRKGRIPRPESYSSLGGRRSRFSRIPRPESYSSLD